MHYIIYCTFIIITIQCRREGIWRPLILMLVQVSTIFVLYILKCSISLTIEIPQCPQNILMCILITSCHMVWAVIEIKLFMPYILVYLSMHASHDTSFMKNYKKLQLVPMYHCTYIWEYPWVIFMALYISVCNHHKIRNMRAMTKRQIQIVLATKVAYVHTCSFRVLWKHAN